MSFTQVSLNASHVPVGPKDLHPRHAKDPPHAAAALHAEVLHGPAVAAGREDQPDRQQHLWI